jgi:hypothetical protein
VEWCLVVWEKKWWLLGRGGVCWVADQRL